MVSRSPGDEVAFSGASMNLPAAMCFANERSPQRVIREVGTTPQQVLPCNDRLQFAHHRRFQPAGDRWYAHAPSVPALIVDLHDRVLPPSDSDLLALEGTQI